MPVPRAVPLLAFHWPLQPPIQHRPVSRSASKPRPFPLRSANKEAVPGRGGVPGAVSHSPLPGNALLGDGGLLPGNGASWARLRACADETGRTMCTRRRRDG